MPMNGVFYLKYFQINGFKTHTYGISRAFAQDLSVRALLRYRGRDRSNDDNPMKLRYSSLSSLPIPSPNLTLPRIDNPTVAAQSESIKLAIAEVNRLIDETAVEIKGVEKAIAGVEASLKESTLPADIAFYREEVRQLREEKRLLLEKESQLRDEKKTLINESIRLTIELNRLADIKANGTIRIPDDIKFTKEPQNLETSLEDCPHLVGLTPVIAESLRLIDLHLPRVTNPSFRKPPLALFGLARGGKTTALRVLYDALQLHEIGGRLVHPIYISFNGNQNFKIGEDEKQDEVLARVIASQFVDVPPNKSEALRCSVACLTAFLGEKYGDDPVVLLIDELNGLGNPLETDAAGLLRAEFLDKRNRYLVFTSHFRMAVDVVSYLGQVMKPPSPRGMEVIALPFSTDLNELRRMSKDCESLTNLEVALYGGIPALIYMVKTLRYKVRSRVEDLSFLRELKKAKKQAILRHFVRALLSGESAPNSSISPLDLFATSVDLLTRWPLCYVMFILNSLSDDPVVKGITTTIGDLERQSKTTHSGKDWESIVTIGILLHCLHSELNGVAAPLGMGRVSDGRIDKSSFFSMPPEVNSLDTAQVFILDKLAHSSVGTLLFAVPTDSRFPLVDGFLAFKHTDDVKSSRIKAVQFKRGRGNPNMTKPLPDWISESILIRGIATKSKSRKAPANGRWTFLTDAQIRELLGYSLSSLYPKDLPKN